MPTADRAITRLRPRRSVASAPPGHDPLRQLEELLAAFRASIEVYADALALLHQEVGRQRALARPFTPAEPPRRPRSARRSEQVRALRQVEQGDPDAPLLLSPLTRREWQVAQLVALGLTNRQIAERLILSRGTVANHVEHIRQKLGTRTRSAVAAWAVQHRASWEQGAPEPVRVSVAPDCDDAGYTPRLVNLADSDVA